jgi:short-subunit dehydrogenase
LHDLKGKVALVTGASRGIGVHIARTLAGQGMRVALSARSAADLEKRRAELEASGAEAIAVPADVGDRASLEGLVHSVEKAFGAIDVLVNNAALEQYAIYDAMDLDDIEQVIRVNLTGPMLLARMVLPGMIGRGRGHIVNIASLGGLGGTPYAETYTATKHGLVGFTRSLRATIRGEGHPIGVSVVCPGFIDGTGMFQSMKEQYGVVAPATLGASPAEDVSLAVLRAIRTNECEIVVNRKPVRPWLVVLASFPGLADWLAEKTGSIAFFRQVMKTRSAQASILERERDGQTSPAASVGH